MRGKAWSHSHVQGGWVNETSQLARRRVTMYRCQWKDALPYRAEVGSAKILVPGNGMCEAAAGIASNMRAAEAVD